MRFPLLCLFAIALVVPTARAEEPFFKKNDVIALVGGEDMVVASEYGYLELLLTRALPDYHLRFRSLAWEGDTVFEQPRDLNFPTWEEALDQIGATVVICQFGQMESLAGKEKLPEFVAAYEKLLERFRGQQKRRMVLITPSPFAGHDQKNAVLDTYREAIRELASKHANLCVDNFEPSPLEFVGVQTRDGVHLSSAGQWDGARVTMQQLDIPFQRGGLVWSNIDGGTLRQSVPNSIENLRNVIVAKNKLWFDYWRVQNWAFLAGDRTSQPSSRDWRDPSKRWFPAEREEFLPLVEAKEKEIDALAEKLAGK